MSSHSMPNETGNVTRTFVGSYDLSLEQRWRIRKLGFNLHFIDGNADPRRAGQGICSSPRAAGIRA